MTGVTHRQRRECSAHGTDGQAVAMGRAGLGGVDTYRIHKMIAARVTTAR
jgi:hypothetical protein